MDEAQAALGTGAFKHILVPIGVVVGLGLARVVMAFSQYVAERGRVQFAATHTLWTALLFLMFVGFWWMVWGLSHAEASRWTFFTLLYLILGPILIYLPSILLLPDLPEEGSLDLGALFDRLAPAVLACLAGFVVWLAFAEMYLLQESFWVPKRVNQAVVFSVFSVGAAVPSRSVRAGVALVAGGAILFALSTLRAGIG